MAAEYYKTTYGAEHRAKKGRSVFGVLLDSVMFLVTLAVVALFIATLIIPNINPVRAQELSTLGLIAPFTYAAILVLTLYWIVRWRVVIAVVMILLSMVGMFSVSSFYKIEFRRSYGAPQVERGEIKIMSYNVRSFIDDNGKNRLDSIVEVIRGVNPDIVCFQEMGFSVLADSLLEELKLKPMPKSLSRVNLSPAIYSRYPIIKAQRVDSLRNFVWADIVLREDTIRVFNNHLHTTAIRKEDSSYLEDRQFLNEESSDELRSMISRLTENNILRAEQADTLVEMVKVSPYPSIVCGDFNDTPISYTVRRVGRVVDDVFREVGRGYSHTYRGFFNMLRIDYVFCSSEFEPIAYEVVDTWGLESKITRRGDERDTVLVRQYGNKLTPPNVEQAISAGVAIVQDSISGEYMPVDNSVRYSDHYPIVVRLKLNKTNK